MRAYALERLDESGLHDQVADAHLAWADDQAEPARGDLVETGQSRYTYDLVVDDLRAALWRGPSRRAQPATGHALARRMAHLAYGRRFFIEARVRFEEAATLAADGQRRPRTCSTRATPPPPCCTGGSPTSGTWRPATGPRRPATPATAALALALAAERTSRMMATFATSCPTVR